MDNGGEKVGVVGVMVGCGWYWEDCVAELDFGKSFMALTGYAPLSWQSRLFSEYFEASWTPGAVDIPTGLGKTAVMALWLTARARRAKLLRRLVYVVDQRAVPAS